MQRFGPPPSYPHLKIPGLNTSFSDPQYNFYLKQANQDEDVGKIINNIYGGVKVNKVEEIVDKSMWGILRDVNEEQEIESLDGGIENEINKKTQNFDLSQFSSGTALTSGME